MIIVNDQEINKKELNNLRNRDINCELPNILLSDQIEEIKKSTQILISQTTRSRRIGKLFRCGDYYYYISDENSIIPTIIYNIFGLNIDSENNKYYSKFMVKINYQLYMSTKDIKWFTKNDINNYDKLKYLKLYSDSILLLPFAIPDKILYEKNNKRMPIPKKIRQSVFFKQCGNDKVGNCYVCNKSIKNIENGWHCAHIVPYIICKCHEINNLKVTCPSCNLQCGTQNLNIFKININN